MQFKIAGLALAVAAGLWLAPSGASAQTADGGFPLDAQGWGGKTGANTWMSRWVEDWSYLSDPSKKKGYFDGLKYIPFNDRGDVYLTLSMEQRFRGNYYAPIGLKDTSPSQTVWQYRAFVGADLHLGQHARFYTELAHANIGGRNVTPSAVQKDDARVQQAFFDLTGSWGQADVGVRVGRQDFQDGPQWLVTTRENANMHFTLDGVRAWAIGNGARVDVFDYRYVDEDMGYFDDGTLSNKRFSGALAGFRLPGSGSLYLEPFWFHARDDAKRWATQVAQEKRDFYGLHFWGSQGALSFDTAAMYETGDFGERDIEAYGLYSMFNWTLSKQGMAPKIGFHADLTSGGGGYGTGTLHNGSILFGTQPYYSWAGWFGGANYMDFSPTFQFSPVKDVSVQLGVQRMWRQKTDDAIYTGSGTPYAGTQLVDGRRIGDSLRLNASWKLNQYVSLTARAERFFAARAMEDAGFGDATFVGGWMTFRF